MSPRGSVTAHVALGANLGEPIPTLVRAVNALSLVPGTSVVAKSALYRTAPVEASGPDYFNAVVEILTTLGAPDLLVQLQKIEQSEGRQRPWRHAPRTLDLDLLLYGSATVDSPSLTVPHPRMQERGFVMVPLADIAPQWSAVARSAPLQQQAVTRVSDPTWDGPLPGRGSGSV